LKVTHTNAELPGSARSSSGSRRGATAGRLTTRVNSGLYVPAGDARTAARGAAAGGRTSESDGGASVGTGSGRTRGQGRGGAGTRCGRSLPVAGNGVRSPMTARTARCHEQRMLRALHGRWPYRRSHCRDDHHLLVCVRPGAECWCPSGRRYPLAGLRATSRRPQES
jgi:hypothetical protein